jgi:topoisomerase IA-like protein
VGALPVIRVVGVDPDTGRDITVRLAPDRLVIADGETVAALEDRDTAFGITLERTLQLLERERCGGADDGTAGVREPRRPHPPLGTLEAAVDVPEEAAG